MKIDIDIEQEFKRGKRFQFGKNWQHFLSVYNEAHISEAEKSLQQMLEVEELRGQSFLDIGSGSGLFSLAARRLGATVHSFDYDSQSVACTQSLKHRYFPHDPNWIIEKGSVLDADYIKSLGHFNVVYSWGVIHHTGSMWQGLEYASWPVAKGGKLFVAIYNDQGRASQIWKTVKQTYNQIPQKLKFIVLYPAFIRLWMPTMLRDLISKNQPFKTWNTYQINRGMSPWINVVDWVGGYPFEVAKPEEIFNFYRKKGFTLLNLKTCAGGHGCNEFVFVRGNIE